MNELTPYRLKERAARAEPQTRAFFKQLKKNRKKLKLEELVQELHEEAFNMINCLDCANCCKSISPIIQEKDIDRIARYLRLKPADFIGQYLHLDEDGDYVFWDTPCPLLFPDNYCSVYDKRPRSCREYPHTDHHNFYQVMELSVKNTYICPAVFYIIEQMKKRLHHMI